MDHYIVYEGMFVALAAMQRAYIEGPLMPWLNNPTTTAGVLLKPPVMLEAEIKWYEELAGDRTQKIFAILVRDTPDGEWRYVGHTGLHRISWPDATATTGTIIGDATVHRKGYGTEAKLLLLHHAFTVLGVRKIMSEVKAFNGNSFGHLLKCGYQVIGVRKRQHFHDGGYVDEILFEVFKEEFEPIWALYKETGELPKLTPVHKKLMKKLM